MLRRLSYCLLAMFFLASCAREELELEQEWDGPVITFTVNTEEEPATKADDIYQAPGENPYRENNLNRVDFFFYPGHQTDKDATYHTFKKLSSLTRNSAKFALELTTNQVNYLIFPTHSETTEATVFAIANATDELIAAIYDLDDLSLPSLKSLVVQTDFEEPENHRQPDFLMSGQVDITLTGRTQKEVAKGQIDLSRYACKLTVGIKTEEHVELETAHSDADGNKIFEEWTPIVQEMKIYIVDAVKNVSLGGVPAATEGGVADPVYFGYRSNPMLFFENTGTQAEPDYEQIFDKTGDYYNTYPMYMYPQHWEEGVSEGNTREPYLKLVLPWERTPFQKDGVNIKYAKKEFYYKILIPKDRRGEGYQYNFIRNSWYHYNIEVGMLGADTDDASVVVNPVDFYIYYWQDKNVVIKHADIGNAKYLDVDQTEYTLNNINQYDVLYTTSHPITYEVLSVTRPYYGKETSGTAQGGTIVQADGTHQYDYLYPEDSYYLDYAAADTESWFEDIGAAIRFTHTLHNDYSDASFDYSPYTIFLNIRHFDATIGSDYSKTVKIVQYPAIYIEAQLNSDQLLDGINIPYETDNASTHAWRNFEYNGFTFVDGERRMRELWDGAKYQSGMYDLHAKDLVDNHGKTWNRNDQSQDLEPEGNTVRPLLEWLQWRTLNFTGGNRNLYNIVVTVLPADSKFKIGDPRTKEVDNLGYGLQPGYIDFAFNEEGTPFKPAYPIDGTDLRPLSYYHPADDSERTKYMIAPSYRVASKFGGMEYYNGATMESAIYKCATYQEDGYPAGRWRLPTMAEINFIENLTTNANFVTLFGKTSFYWSAHGAMQPGSTKPDTSRRYALARCIYDSWYWDNVDAAYARLPEGIDPSTGEPYRNKYVLGDLPLLGDPVQ